MSAFKAECPYAGCDPVVGQCSGACMAAKKEATSRAAFERQFGKRSSMFGRFKTFAEYDAALEGWQAASASQDGEVK